MEKVFEYIEKLPPGQHAISLRLVYAYKGNEPGIIERFA